MINSKKLRYFILASLIITMPVHPKNLFNYCTDAYQLTKQSVVDVVNGQATTRTKIVIGAALLSISALLIYMVTKYTKEVPEVKPKPTPAELEREADEAFFGGKGINIYSISGKHLIKAINDNDKELILMFLKHRIDIGCCYVNFDESPLAAAIMKDAVLVDLLLKNAKNINERLIDDAICFAIKKGRLINTPNKSFQILLKYTKEPYVFLGDAASHNTNALEFLIQYGKSQAILMQADFDAALFSAVRQWSHKEQQKGMKMLIQHGANVNRKRLVQGARFSDPIHRQIKTPLSEAVLHGSAWTVRFLLKHNAQLVEPESNVSVYDYFEDVPNSGEKN